MLPWRRAILFKILASFNMFWEQRHGAAGPHDNPDLA